MITEFKWMKWEHSAWSNNSVGQTYTWLHFKKKCIPERVAGGGWSTIESFKVDDELKIYLVWWCLELSTLQFDKCIVCHTGIKQISYSFHFKNIKSFLACNLAPSVEVESSVNGWFIHPMNVWSRPFCDSLDLFSTVWNFFTQLASSFLYCIP